MKPIDQHEALRQDHALEALLRQDAAQHQQQYIDNDGFSERVMTAVAGLPNPSSNQLSQKKRLFVLSAAALLGTIIVMFFGAGNNFLIDAVMDLATKTITPSVLSLVFIIVSVGVATTIAAMSER
jgi:hypothetical protein